MTIALAQLRQMVRDRLGVPAHDSFFDGSVLDTNINLAVLAVEAEYRWPWSEAADEVTIPTTGQITVPTNWRATRALLLANRELEEWPYYDLRWRYGDEQSGLPTHFSLVDKTLHVRPKPASDTAAVHIYYTQPDLLASDEDTTRIPTEHVGVIIAKAAQLSSTREDDRPSAEMHLAEYLTGLERMRKDAKGTTRPQRTRVREGSWL